MTDVTLASKSAAATLTGSELLYGEQGGSAVKVTPAQIAAYVRQSGDWTPTVTAGTNVAAASAEANVCRYVRHGDYVTVSGRILITPTAAGGILATMTLPFNSNFAIAADAGGPATAKAAAISDFQAAHFTAQNGVPNTLQVAFNAVNVVQYTVRFAFTYKILP